MKPGDLVRLKGWAGDFDTGVAVSWGPPAGGLPHEVTHFDTGTLALLLRADEVQFRTQPRAVSFILIGGRMGWVWPQELEPL